ncbi:MAG: hypothetical protein WBP10_12865 [Thermoanaerobaculia bacterium]
MQFSKAMTAFPEDVESDDVAEGYPPNSHPFWGMRSSPGGHSL